jgi:hypothetical protein
MQTAYCTTADFGYKTKGGSTSQASTSAYGSKFQITEDGTAQSITVYIKQVVAASNVKVAIYNSTLALLAEGSGSVALGYDDWKTITLISNPSLIANSYYWLMVMAETATCTIYYHTGTTNQGCYLGVTYANFPPNSMNPAGYVSREYSIYCTYTITEVGTTENFYGNIGLGLTVGHENIYSFIRYGTMPLTLTFTGTASFLSQVLLEVFGTIPLTLAVDAQKTVSWILQQTIPLTFSFVGAMSYWYGTVLFWFGTIPISFAIQNQKALEFTLYALIPVSLSFIGLVEFISHTLNFYGTIGLTLQFVSEALHSSTASAIGGAAGLAFLAIIIALTAMMLVFFWRRK